MKKAAFNTPAGAEGAGRSSPRPPPTAPINKVSWTGRWVEPNDAFASGTSACTRPTRRPSSTSRGTGKWVNADTLGVAQCPGGWATPEHPRLRHLEVDASIPTLACDFIKIATNEKWG